MAIAGQSDAHTLKTRNSAIADKPRDAFRGQTRLPNMVPFRAVFQTFDFKKMS